MKKTIKKILREFEDDWGWAKDLNPINIFKGVFYIDVDGLTKGEKHNVIKKIFDLGFSFLPITGFSDNDYNSEIKGYLLVNDVYKKRALFKDTQKFSNTPRVEGLPLDTYLSSQEFLDIAKTLLKESEDDGLGWIRDSEMGESITNLKSGDYFKITIIDGDSLEDYIGDNDLSEIDPYTKIFVVLYFTRVYGDEHYGFSDTYREKDTDVLIRPIDGVGGWVRVDGLFVEKYNFKTEPNINESENDGLDWIRDISAVRGYRIVELDMPNLYIEDSVVQSLDLPDANRGEKFLGYFSWVSGGIHFKFTANLHPVETARFGKMWKVVGTSGDWGFGYSWITKRNTMGKRARRQIFKQIIDSYKLDFNLDTTL